MVPRLGPPPALAIAVHCLAGRDRTGWLISMLLYALGADDATVRREYLRSEGADLAELTAGLDAIAERYGTEDGMGGVSEYLADIGLEDATLARLRTRLAD